jgi:hypothetical protein
MSENQLKPARNFAPCGRFAMKSRSAGEFKL